MGLVLDACGFPPEMCHKSSERVEQLMESALEASNRRRCLEKLQSMAKQPISDASQQYPADGAIAKCYSADLKVVDECRALLEKHPLKHKGGIAASNLGDTGLRVASNCARAVLVSHKRKSL